jgi:hypothetical protein
MTTIFSRSRGEAFLVGEAWLSQQLHGARHRGEVGHGEYLPGEVPAGQYIPVEVRYPMGSSAADPKHRQQVHPHGYDYHPILSTHRLLPSLDSSLCLRLRPSLADRRFVAARPDAERREASHGSSMSSAGWQLSQLRDDFSPERTTATVSVALGCCPMAFKLIRNRR